MNTLRYVGIIPARFASTRFPGKPLVKIGGKTMIERVWERVCDALDEAYVATDDLRIYDAVKSFGGNVVMTATHHKSGTDRCEEAYRNINSDADVVINIQGDEPFIQKSQLEAIKSCFDDSDVDIATLVREFDPELGIDALQNPNTPKVVLDNNMRALYFSRSVIPYLRGVDLNNWCRSHKYYTHIGMYAYRSEILRKITKLPQSLLEIAESLEQLRWLQNGYTIRAAISNCPTIGIDTPEDLQNAEKHLSELNNLK